MAEFPVVPGHFDLTAVSPFDRDYRAQYPLLAIRITCSEAGRGRGIGLRRAASRMNLSLFDRMQMWAKDTHFLTAQPDGAFRWVLPDKSSLFRPELASGYPAERRRRLTRYSLEQDEENTTMIYPLRPFSITAVDLEGFDTEKAYPVLAIDVDRFLPEEEAGEVDPQLGPQPETMALFLVGNDNGEFVWVAEDQCKLFPLE